MATRRAFEHEEALFITATIIDKTSNEAEHYRVKITKEQRDRLLYDYRVGRRPTTLGIALAHAYQERFNQSLVESTEFINLFLRAYDLRFAVPQGQENEQPITFLQKARMEDEAIDLTKSAIIH